MSKDERGDPTDDHIDQNLKKVYEEVLNEELPDRFKDLLAKLKSGETPGSSEKTE